MDDATLLNTPADAQAYFARCEARYQKWLASQPAITAMVIIAPYKYLATTSHKQIGSDYCDPATCEIIDHFFRGTKRMTQSQWAAYVYVDSAENRYPMWTDEEGTYMWVMSTGLKQKTGKAYTYTSGNTATQVYNRTQYGIDRGRPVAYGLRIWAEKWPNDVYSYAGHIVCGRGYDWRYNKIALDDPYPENEYRTGGGDTYGKKSYNKDVVAGGVTASENKQVIY